MKCNLNGLTVNFDNGTDCDLPMNEVDTQVASESLQDFARWIMRSYFPNREWTSMVIVVTNSAEAKS